MKINPLDNNEAALYAYGALEQLRPLEHDAPGAVADETPYGGLANYACKRIVDCVGAGLGLLLLSPLMILVAVLIRLDSKGPALFRQQRLGLGGRPFRMVKFRTMVTDAEAQQARLEHLNESRDGLLFKMKDDPRVTPLGRFLRKSSIDELPQLFNVLAGEMSLVGPRPLPVRDCTRIGEADPEGLAARQSVLPGLTGPWQISGRSEVGGDGMLRLDVDYVESQSLAGDLRIIWKTCFVILKRRGAY